MIIISNGYGEDLVATELSKAYLKKKTAKYPDLHVYPLFGKGYAYKQAGIKPSLESEPLPSGGFLRNPLALWRDVCYGLISRVLAQRKTLQSVAYSGNKIIAVGDVFCLWMARSALKKNPKAKLFFIPTAKSDHFMPHSAIEYYLIKKWAKKVYPRDSLTEIGFADHGILARYLGNPMTDTLKPSGVDLGFCKEKKSIGILPGSRHEAYANLSMILTIIEHLSQYNQSLNYGIALAPTFCMKTFIQNDAPKQWIYHKTKQSLCHECSSITIKITNNLADLLANIHMIIGLAGTANEQAIYAHRPVLCFPGHGPQSSAKRFIEQGKLLGDKLHFIAETDPISLAQKMVDLLNSLPLEKPPFHASSAAEAMMRDILTCEP